MRTILPQSITDMTRLGVCSCKRQPNSIGIWNCNTEWQNMCNTI